MDTYEVRLSNGKKILEITTDTPPVVGDKNYWHKGRKWLVISVIHPVVKVA